MEIASSPGNSLVLEELKKISKLMGIFVTQGRNPGEKILILYQAGLSPREISGILGVSSNLVSVTIYNEKKKKKNSK